MSENDPFKILGDQSVPEKNGTPVLEEDQSGELKDRIERLIKNHEIFLFMKGTPDFPQCGFSANVVGLLNSLNIKFNSFDILSDMDIRQGVKEYANWPTYPQLWVKGQFVGGNDIITEMFHAGDLEKILKQ